jgi:hypothetical protein
MAPMTMGIVGGLLRGEHGISTPSKNDVYVEANELVCQLGKSLW